MSIFLECSSIC